MTFDMLLLVGSMMMVDRTPATRRLVVSEQMRNNIACRKLLEAMKLVQEVIEGRPNYEYRKDLIELKNRLDEESMAFDTMSDEVLNDEVAKTPIV